VADESFELRIQPNGDSQYGLALYQRPHRAQDSKGNAEDWQLVARVRGQPMRAVIDQVLAAVKKAGYKPSELMRGREEPFYFTEGRGVRLGLLFLAIKPLRKTIRMGDISEHVQAMTDEEVYYWFSKVSRPPDARRAQRALRVLLAEE
jgi:hypothetical protein